VVLAKIRLIFFISLQQVNKNVPQPVKHEPNNEWNQEERYFLTFETPTNIALIAVITKSSYYVIRYNSSSL